jgi:small-conductance mechanosensitive channel
MIRRFGFEDQLYLVVSVVSGLVLYLLLFYLLRYLARSKKRELPKLLDRYIFFPGLFLMIVIAVTVGISFVEEYFNPKALALTHQLIKILIIAGVGFLLIRILTVFKELTIHHYRDEHPTDYRLRRVRTKFQLLQRVLNFVIILLTVGAILMTFQAVRQVGTTILASAGVVGLIVGFAAQKSIGSLFAGIQIAISEPVRIDDVVVVDGHFGMIQEMTLTYAILNKYDGKRLVIPINYFLENTFENWTRTSPDLLAKVYIYVDYSVPVEDLRQQFFSMIGESPLFDKRKARFLVTNTDASTVELRGTASAANSDDAFDLECQLREQLIAYIQEHYPDSLPKTRVEMKALHPAENK